MSTLWSVCTFTFECCAAQLHPFPAFKKLLFMFAVSLAREKPDIYSRLYAACCMRMLPNMCVCLFVCALPFSPLLHLCAHRSAYVLWDLFSRNTFLCFCRRTKMCVLSILLDLPAPPVSSALFIAHLPIWWLLITLTTCAVCENLAELCAYWLIWIHEYIFKPFREVHMYSCIFEYLHWCRTLV